MIGATVRWIASPKPVWACALITIAVLTWVHALGATEPVLRIAGLVLQLLGVLTVALGLSVTRKFFGRPPILAVIQSWFRTAPFLSKSIVTGSANLSPGPATLKARGYGIHNPLTSSVDDRLASLENNIQLIHSRISGLEAEYDQNFKKVSQALKEETSVRLSESSMITSRLEAFGTGGIHISAIGVVWLFIGLILSTAGLEIAKQLGNA